MHRILPFLALSCGAADPATAVVRVERVFAQDEGPWNPADWIIISSVPHGMRVRLTAGSATLAALVPHIAAHRIADDQGRILPGRDLHRIILGARIRIAAAAAGGPFGLASATAAFRLEPVP
ncbi:MAG: hypothetical protein RLZZ127_151 [Planctomycetota bacterium]|jgi:hypothetical protein